uniref:Gag-Pol polyprotein n=1 Tax=Tanacetum cinerariifolium TaxID=118510 RepID=A0A6L2KW85_TANCI|nr:hypothetical protein [Tanacetum cinerariifolium]
MSNTNMQTQTSNALHNAIMEAGGKDRPPMLASGIYNPPYKFKWTEKTVPVAEGSSETTTEGFYKMMNELVRNQYDVTNHQVNVQFLLQLQTEWKRFVTLVKQRQELKTVSYHKLYDILKQHQNEVNEIRAERLAPSMVTEDDEMSKEKETDKLMALIYLSFKKIYKPTNNNLRTSSNTSRANQDNSPRINRGTGYKNQRVVNVAEARKTVEQADWKDDTDDESDEQELEAHYMYMALIQEVNLDSAITAGPIFDAEPLQKVQNDDDNYNVFGDDQEYLAQPESINEPYPDICYDKEQDDQGDTDELAQ